MRMRWLVVPALALVAGCAAQSAPPPPVPVPLPPPPPVAMQAPMPPPPAYVAPPRKRYVVRKHRYHVRHTRTTRYGKMYYYNKRWHRHPASYYKTKK